MPAPLGLHPVPAPGVYRAGIPFARHVEMQRASRGQHPAAFTQHAVRVRHVFQDVEPDHRGKIPGCERQAGRVRPAAGDARFLAYRLDRRRVQVNGEQIQVRPLAPQAAQILPAAAAQLQYAAAHACQRGQGPGELEPRERKRAWPGLALPEDEPFGIGSARRGCGRRAAACPALPSHVLSLGKGWSPAGRPARGPTAALGLTGLSEGDAKLVPCLSGRGDIPERRRLPVALGKTFFSGDLGWISTRRRLENRNLMMRVMRKLWVMMRQEKVDLPCSRSLNTMGISRTVNPRSRAL